MARSRGTTVAELLVAVVFLGVTAGSVLSAITYCNSRQAYARRRGVVMELLRTQLDTARANTSLSTGTTTSTSSVQGLSGTVSISTTVSVPSGYSNLYQIQSQATWVEPYLGGTRNDQMSFATWVPKGSSN